MSQYPPPPGQGFPPPPAQGFGAPPAAPSQSNGMAIASFVCGLLGCFLITPLLGIIFGIVGLGNAKKKGGSGRGLAIAGIILSVLWIGAGGLFGGTIMAIFNAAKPARVVADAFAKDLAAGNVQAAKGRATSNVSDADIAAAVAALQPMGTISDSTMFGASVQANPGTKFWILGGALTFAGQSQPVQYVVKVDDQNGTLLVDGFSFTVNGKVIAGGDAPDPNTKPGR